MFLLAPRLVLLLVLTQAVSVVISEAEHDQDVANRVAISAKKHSKVKKPQGIIEDTSKTINRDPAHEVNSKRDALEEETKFFDTNHRGLGHAIRAYLSQGDESRKRSIDNNTVPWAPDIPLIFSESYPEPFYQHMVMRVARYVSSKTCLTINDETERWDPKNPQWFTTHGYKWESYIKVSTGSSCSTSGPGPSNGSYLEMRPCHDSDIILHEMLHAIGVPHEQQSFISDRYINVFMDTIIPDYQYTYDATLPSMLTTYFDPTSTMLYKSGTWSLINDHTIVPIRPDQGKPDESVSSEDITFEQINKRHKCAEVFCPGVSTDCGIGYLTYIDKVCKCVCPPEYDSSKKCKSLLEKGDKTLTWDIPLSLIAGGDNYKCPDGFNPTGWISFCGTKASKQEPSPAPIPQVEQTTYIPICSKPNPLKNIDWNSVPLGGRYCFGKASGAACDGVFTEATVEFQSSCKPETNGTLGDITVKSNNNITMKLCCSNYENVNFLAVLPNLTPFRMFTIYNCPYIQGMRTYAHSLNLYTEVSGTYGGPSLPLTYLYPNNIQLNLCYFQPAVYGCNQIVTLTSSNKKVTISTPGYPLGRPANTRCFYCFNAPEGTQLRVTFKDYDLEKDDKIRIKRYHKWSDWFRLDNENPWMQFVTETNYLCMEFWSGYLKDVPNKGASFTAELLFDSDSCYDTDQNGLDYLGTTSVSETYEECLDWKDTVDCSDSPVNAEDALTGYFEKNYCRNPRGKLLQPWCYTYKNNTSCIKRYCDVCNTKKPVDAIKTTDCLAAIAGDPTFCKTAVQRFGCFKTCLMTQAPAGTISGSCKKPPTPKDGELVGAAKSSYKVGERAYVRCKSSSEKENATVQMLCTKDGWNAPTSVCTDCPTDWTLYGDRCIYFSDEAINRPDALAFCKSFDRNGTLMHIRNATDQALMRDIRTQANSLITNSWFGAILCDAAKGTWCLLDTSIAMTYTNWVPDASIKNAKSPYAYMYREISSSQKDGKWYETGIDDTTSLFTFFCQIDRLYPPVTTDKFPTCQDVLSENPNFCKSPKTTIDAGIFCGKSCGLLSGTTKCSEPKSSKYKRTSGTGSVKTGEVMTFQCNSGYFLNGGDLTRACGLDGSLLGTAPDCISNPTSVDVGYELVMSRFYTMGSRTAFVIDTDKYRVPINGKITTWYYYCENPGLLYFLVFRKSGSGYKLIGFNSQDCITDWRWGFKVPLANQTAVLEGDLVGAYTPTSYVLSMNECGGALIELISLQTDKFDNIAQVQNATKYTKKTCTIPALGYRVEK